MDRLLIKLNDRLLLRVNEAAELMGISRSKAYEMIAAGELPYIKIRDSIRIPRMDLQQWIEDQKKVALAGERGAAGSESAK